MLNQFLCLLIVAWLPGAVLYRVPWLGRARRAELDADERVFWAVLASLGISLSIALVLAWLGRYTFERLLAADVLVAAGLAALSRFDLRLGRNARKPRWTVLLPLALIALGLWRFFPPAEYIIGGKDPGVYMNEGIQIAQRGTFLYEDPVVASVPAFARDLFFPSHEHPAYYSVRFMGFWILDPDSGLVVGQFPHLYPAAIAIGYGIDGLTGARRTVGVFAVLGLLAVYFAGARLLGRTVAFAAVLLLSLHLTQVWFGRYPNSEVLMQAFGFAALLAMARAHVDDIAFFAPLAGFLAGLLFFLRMDAALLLAGLVAGGGLFVMTGGRPRWSLVASAAVVLIAAGVYLAGPMHPYTERGILFFNTMYAWQRFLIVAGPAALLAALAAARRQPSVRLAIERYAPVTLASVLAIAAVYALWFREPAGKLAPDDAYALRTFANYYFTVPAVLAAVLGYALSAQRLFWRGPALFTTFAVFSLFFFYKIRIVPDHFWMSRRFVHMIIPGALLFVAAAALGWRTGRRRLVAFRGAPGDGERRWTLLPRWVLGLILLTLVGLEYARASAPLLGHVEYAGVIPRLERLAASLRDDDLLIVESRDAGTDVHTLALPLAYIYARNVLVLHSPVPDKAVFGAFLQWAQSRYARVLFLGAGGTELLSREWSVRAILSERFQVPEYDAPAWEFPRHARAKQFDYTVYEFTPPADEEGGAGFVLDVGESDDLNVLRFYAKEVSDGRTFRWSQDVSYVVLPYLHASNREVTIWMHDGGRPPAAPPPDVTLALADEVLGTVRVQPGFAPYSVEIPEALAARLAASNAPVRLRIAVPTWKPEEVLGTPDDRELGIMVDRVAVK